MTAMDVWTTALILFAKVLIATMLSAGALFTFVEYLLPPIKKQYDNRPKLFIPVPFAFWVSFSFAYAKLSVAADSSQFDSVGMTVLVMVGLALGAGFWLILILDKELGGESA